MPRIGFKPFPCIAVTCNNRIKLNCNMAKGEFVEKSNERPLNVARKTSGLLKLGDYRAGGQQTAAQ